MADAKKKSGGNPVTKKAGPLPVWGWFAVAGGTYLVYRYLKAREAAGAATAASGTTGGTLIPNDIGLPSTTSTSAAGTFSSTADWTQAALTYLTGQGLDSADAYNALTSYINGNCVSAAGYQAVASALSSSDVGLPPGGGQALVACPDNSSEVLSGGGYQQVKNGVAGAYTTVTSSTGRSVFAPILNSEQLLGVEGAAGQGGGNVYYQPQPGVFVPVSENQNLAGLPLFQLQSGTGA